MFFLFVAPVLPRIVRRSLPPVRRKRRQVNTLPSLFTPGNILVAAAYNTVRNEIPLQKNYSSKKEVYHAEISIL